MQFTVGLTVGHPPKQQNSIIFGVDLPAPQVQIVALEEVKADMLLRRRQDAEELSRSTRTSLKRSQPTDSVALERSEPTDSVYLERSEPTDSVYLERSEPTYSVYLERSQPTESC